MPGAAPKVSLFIASTIDGFIAKKDGSISFLDPYQNVVNEDYGYQSFMEKVETVLMGRKTFDQLLSMGHQPHSDKELYVISGKMQKPTRNRHFYSGNVSSLVSELKESTTGTIFIDGGARLINSLLSYQLVDEIYLSIIPILLGDGIRLFKEMRPEQKFKLKEHISYPNGLVQLHYIK